MKNKILIVGNGYIASHIKNNLKCHLSKQRISKYEDIEKLIKKYNPNLIINCIGHTGKNNVDDCEKVIDKTLLANSFVPILLLEACLRHHIKLVHISSGCVFHYDYAKQRPINENYIPDYYDLFYSRTKIYFENILAQLKTPFKFLNIRIRIPLNTQPHPRNLLTKLIKYKTVIDVPNSVTYIPDFIKALKHLISINAHGTYNIVLKGGIRYPELMKEYQKRVPQFEFKTINYKKLNLKRTNLILSTTKLEKTGFKVRTVQEVVKECVAEYIKY
jgi:3,5-epimerase/4-reductase